MDPRFLTWLAGRCRASVYTPDLVLASFRSPAGPALRLVRRQDLWEHPRVRLALQHRREVEVYSDAEGRGLLALAWNVLGVRTVSVEVEPSWRGRGLGRRLALAARGLAPAAEPLFASISPGNAASLRAFLVAGYGPVGSEALLFAEA